MRFNASIFQPMGRHHYPFLAVYLIGFALALEAGSRLLSRFRKGFGHVPRIALVVLSLAFSLYAYRFVLVEQFHPLNAQHDPRFRITDEALRHAATNVRLIAPAPGAEVHGTPTFHWEAEPDRTYGLELHHDPSFVSHADYRMSQRILRTFRTAVPTSPRTATLAGRHVAGWHVHAAAIDLGESGDSSAHGQHGLLAHPHVAAHGGRADRGERAEGVRPSLKPPSAVESPSALGVVGCGAVPERAGCVDSFAFRSNSRWNRHDGEPDPRSHANRASARLLSTFLPLCRRKAACAPGSRSGGALRLGSPAHARAAVFRAASSLRCPRRAPVTSSSSPIT
ncbi:MAG: hypothetical protein H6834_16235 [Planctomycetes bacterium]|nr:hypothetical protein [Planctomycetota bacterium]